MSNIHINIRDKLPQCEPVTLLCGNSDYRIVWELDEEWAPYDSKTMRVCLADGTYQDVLFQGQEAALPVLNVPGWISVGLYAGDVHTSRGVELRVLPAITTAGGVPAAPTEDVYAQLTEQLSILGTGVVGPAGSTPIKGVDYWTDEDKQEILSELQSPLPAYARSEAERVIRDVVGVQTDRTLNIAALTDWHIYTEDISTNLASYNWTAAKRAIQAITMISRRINLAAVVGLGDYITGDISRTADEWLDVMGTFNDLFSDIKADNIIKLYGNHDMGYGGTVYIPPVKSHPYISAYNSNMSLGDLVRGYGYQDLPNHKVRMIALNTCEFNSAADYASSFMVSQEQYAWFKQAIDLSAKSDEAEWQILIFSHHPLDWSGSEFPTVLAGYSGKARIIGNIHGHLHNMLTGTIAGTSVKRWCVPEIAYDYNNTYAGWKESTTCAKTPGTANDTSFCVIAVNLDTGVLNRIHYGAGYSDSTNYADDTGDTGDIGGEEENLVKSSINSSGALYNGGLGYKDGYRLNSTGAEVAMSGRAVTGFIPLAYGDRLSASGIVWNGTAPTSNYIAFYDASFNCIQSVSESNFRVYFTPTSDGDITSYKIGTSWSIDLSATAYIRISGAASGANFQVTKL